MTTPGQQPDPEYPNETIIPLDHGGALRCPAFPDDCDYVRVTDSAGVEIGYWNVEEWTEEPALVMGAILGATKSGLELVIRPRSED